MTFQGVANKIRMSRRHTVLAVVGGAVVAFQLGTLATLAQAQVERGQARQDRVVAKLVMGDRCLDYKISAPREGCAAWPAQAAEPVVGVQLASSETLAGPSR